MIVGFVDIGRIVDHHCLNFLFKQWGEYQQNQNHLIVGFVEHSPLIGLELLNHHHCLNFL